MMFGNSLRMLCLFILTCLLLPHQILSKPVPPAEWMKQENAKVGAKEVAKELEFYEAFKERIDALHENERRLYGMAQNREITKEKALQLLERQANADAGDLRFLATQLDVHDSPLLTAQLFEALAKKIINKEIPGLFEGRYALA